MGQIFTVAPRRQRWSVERYNVVKRARERRLGTMESTR